MNQDQLIALLAQSPGYVSGQEMSQTLGVTRGAIWKELSQLREAGILLAGGQCAGGQRQRGPYGPGEVSLLRGAPRPGRRMVPDVQPPSGRRKVKKDCKII